MADKKAIGLIAAGAAAFGIWALARTATGGTIYVCPLCEAEFLTYDELYQHIIDVHGVEPPPENGFEPEPPEEPEPPPEPPEPPPPEPGQDQFFMPATMEAETVDQWTMPPYYYITKYRTCISNEGTAPGTHIIEVSCNRPDWLESWTFEITLAPGEYYIWAYQQLAISPLTFYLTGDWEGNNRSVGKP